MTGALEVEPPAHERVRYLRGEVGEHWRRRGRVGGRTKAFILCVSAIGMVKVVVGNQGEEAPEGRIFHAWKR